MQRFQLYFILPFLFTLLSSCHDNAINNTRIVDENLLDSLSVAVPDSSFQRIGIKMTKQSGIYEIPCMVNGIKMNFIFDTGASNVCLSTTEALFLYKNGYLDDTDFIGESYSRIADGSIVEHMEIMLKSISIEGLVINNVKAVVINSLDAPLLLGQSAIQKFGKVEFTNDSLYITSRVRHVENDTPELNTDTTLIVPNGQKKKSIRLPWETRYDKITRLLSEGTIY